MALSAGAKLGPYEILAPLGAGGMGEVYLAQDTRLERQVALKVLPSDLSADPQRKSRFAREAKLASRLVHPNAAVIYEAAEFERVDFLAMEFVEGESLSSLLRNGPLALAEILALSIQLSDVVSAAHEQGILHRDIKPANIMVTRNGQLKLLDFGLARVRAAAVGADDTTITGVTPFGVAVGTPEYMSPEQAMGGEADQRSDIFSTGVVLYEMATAIRPFRADTSTATLAKILQSAPDPIARWNYESPPEFDRIVRKCLEKSPANRYQSAGELLIDLRNLQRSLASASAVSAPAAVDAAKPRFGRRKAIISGAAAVAAVAAGWGGWKALFPRIRSLAVLPLANSGPPESAYLSDGFTEALINLFSQTPDIRVLARSTVYNSRIPANDPRAAGSKLGVDAVLTGRIDPGPAELVFALQLIASRDGSQLWGDTVRIAAEALGSAAVDIARRVLVAAGLVPHAQPQPARAVDPEAYRAYLRGRYQQNKRTAAGIDASLAQFNEALDHDPAYAPAYAQMAVAWVFKAGYTIPKDAFLKARAAAERALDLDPALAEAHNALALIRMYSQWDWQGAEKSLRRAIELNPNYAGAHSNMSLMLLLRRRFDEAVREVNVGMQLDPLSPVHPATLGYVYYQARQFDRALAQLTKAIANDSKLTIAYLYRGTVEIALGQYDRAIADFETGLKTAPSDTGAIADWGLAHARAGHLDKAREAIARIQSFASQRYVSPYVLAFPHLGLGDTNRAMECLETAAEDRSAWVVYAGVEPKLDALRSNPRFQHLVREIGAA